MSHYELLLGDCLEKLKELPDCSVDAVVTDPPYDLTGASGSGGFMGKKWDATGIAFRPDVWLECLRVLKPGGHLLAFGGTRTYHRMACAIEDAGFEVRDSIHWMYGSGFPKSLSVGKAIDKVNGDGKRTVKFIEWMKTTGLKARTIDEALKNAGLISPTSSFAVHFFNAGQPAIPTKRVWEVLRPMCGDVPEWVDELIERIEAEREVIGSFKSSLGGTVAAGERDTGFIEKHRDKVVPITAPATSEAKKWEGWGTALKPSHEPIVVARKPLIGTVAQNVLEHGTGAINVDACRVGSAGGTRREGKADQPNAAGWENMRGHGIAELNAGRWPPNVIFSHLPECFETECAEGCAVKELDEQSGTRTSGKPGVRRKPHETGSMSGRLGLLGEQETGYGDTGGASRFFPAFRYQAKASRSEREEGLGGLPTARGPVMNERCTNCGKGRLDGRRKGPCCDSPLYGPAAPRGEVRNHHPTVKPVDLMRWLVRLVTPPGGVVLDPFTGSGTTGVAAILEGFRFIGCEREDDYFALAKARLDNAVASQGSKQEKQPMLFDLEGMRHE